MPLRPDAQPTPYAHVNALLTRLLTDMQAVLGNRLVGLYLHGSLVTGDFDDSSDVDLLAALADDLDAATFDALDAMHQAIVADDQQWDDRIEIAYLSLEALQTFRARTSPIGIISPGEPFHIIDAGIDWLMNWYHVRKQGVALVGPPPGALIAPITDAEFVHAVKTHVVAWPGYLEGEHDLPFQSYSILTTCRGLYTVTHGEHVSKARAAAWAAAQFPAWATTIENAVQWRRGEWPDDLDPASTMPQTQRFVQFIVSQVDQP